MGKIKTFEEFLNSVTVVYDQQEKVNYHILNFFKDIEIPTERKHMKYCDYTFIHEGILYPCYIERKNSLTELAGNLGTQEKKTRFYNEFDKVFKNEPQAQVYLLIENDAIDNLLSGTYGGQLSKESFLANFLLVNRRKNLIPYFVNKYNMGIFMLRLFYYHFYQDEKGELLNV